MNNYYLEIECEKLTKSYIGVLYLLRDIPMEGSFTSCQKKVMAYHKKFRKKRRNPKRNTKIKSLKVVNELHQTVYEVKMWK